MFPPNKINSPSFSSPPPSQSLSALLQSLKQQRSFRVGHPSSELRSEQPESHSSPLKDSFSQAAQSMSLNSPLRQSMQEGGLPSKYQGDPALKNRGRMGHANRYTVKQYLIPPQFFTPTKEKLDAHLRFSRILPSQNQSSPIRQDSTHQPNQNSSTPFYQNLSRQAEYSALAQSKVLKKQNIQKNQKIYELNADLVLKYCMVNKLTPSAEAKEILIFFVRLLQIVNYSIPEPKIEKYKDCVFFGRESKRNSLQKSRENSPFGHYSEGLLYFFSGSLFLGELYKNTMHGLGVQLFFKNTPEKLTNPAFPAIYKGQFRNGIMKGYFQVKKQGERYSGDVQNGVYQGYGKLENREGKVQGQFRNGKYVGVKERSKEGKEVRAKYGQNMSMIEMGDLQKSKKIYRSREDSQNIKKDAGTMAQRDPFYRSFSNQHRYNPQPHYKKVPNPNLLQRHHQNQEDFEVDPWSQPHYTDSIKQKPSPFTNNSNEMLEFSYPFGHEIMVEQSTQAYQAPMMRTHRTKVRGGQGYVHERLQKDNPEGSYLSEAMRKGRREGAGQLMRGERDKMCGFRINQKGSRIDSEEDQQEPLSQKC